MRECCLNPDNCTGPRFGHCPRCQPETNKAFVDRMRERCADPAFIEARTSRTAFTKHNRTRMQNIGVNAGAEDAYRVARRAGIDKTNSIRIANDSLHGSQA